ncbi:MAG: 3-coathanger stack domain-containing protein [Bacteroidota bacterium]
MMRILFSILLICSFQFIYAQTRDCDPVVLEGSSVSCMLGIAPTSVVAFKYENASWQQIPMQIDERVLLDIKTPYGPGNDCLYKSIENVAWDVLFYADPNTFTGADTNVTFDVDDELAFMAKDVGELAPNTTCPGGVFTNSKCQVVVSDPLDNNSILGYIYLFEQDGSLSQDAGVDYVDYAYDDFNGDYFNNYTVCINATIPGINPEDSRVTTNRYSQHFSQRWVKDEIKITAGNASGIDILDQHQYFINLNACNRNEDTFSDGKGPIIANKDGPVRGIRSVMGANSGSFTQLDIIFTECRVENEMFYRLHPANGFYEALDLNIDAIGMTFYNNQTVDGNGALIPIAIDGNKDNNVVKEEPNEWELIIGAPGAIACTYTYETDVILGTEDEFDMGLVEGFVAAYQRDWGMSESRKCTGDSMSYNASGFCFRSIVCTDDRYDWANSPSCLPANVNYFSQVRYNYFLSPQTTTSEAAKYASFAKNPLTAMASMQICSNTAPTCTDGIQNGDETAVDCGGSCPPCMACPDETINSVPSTPGIYIYENNNSITSNATIEANVEAHFQAEDYILLTNGFHAKGNAIFRAQILNCAINTAPLIENRSQLEFKVQILPNPIQSDVVRLQLYLPEAGDVLLRLYDLNGRNVGNTQLERAIPKGNHILNYNALNISEGLYLLEVQSAQHRVVKKIMVAN